MEETAAFALEQGLRAVARLPGQRCRWDSGAKQQAGPCTAGRGIVNECFNLVAFSNKTNDCPTVILKVANI